MSESIPNPWQTVSSQEVYDNAWITLHHHEVVTPTGTDGIYGVVHFKNRGIGIIPIDDEDHTWLVGQFRYAIDRYSWEIPEGGGPLSEPDPAETASRELKEECGLDAGRIELLMEFDLSNSVTDEVGAVYVARDLTPCETSPDDTEVLVLRRLPVDEAIRMAIEGEITDSISVMGLMKLALQRNGLT